MLISEKAETTLAEEGRLSILHIYLKSLEYLLRQSSNHPWGTAKNGID
jgi:hypothetical protein